MTGRSEYLQIAASLWHDEDPRIARVNMIRLTLEEHGLSNDKVDEIMAAFEPATVVDKVVDLPAVQIRADVNGLFPASKVVNVIESGEFRDELVELIARYLDVTPSIRLVHQITLGD